MNNLTKREPKLLEALVPILFLVVALSINVLIFGDAGLDGSNQIILIFASCVAGLMAMRLGMKWQDIIQGIQKSINTAIPAILILLIIGSLAGTWLLSGIVPTMIYYGLKMLSPSIFLVAACIVCIVVSLATGSSWSTIATIGIALMSIGKALGMHEGLIAGAIISGAYFGDKMSPLSDTTNLAPAVAGTDLFTHIRYMMFTTIPSISIAILLYLLIGLFGDHGGNTGDVENVLAALDSAFFIHPVLFLVPVGVIFMIVKKVPALPALIVGSLLGGVFALIFQPEIIDTVGMDGSPFVQGYTAIMQAFFGDVQLITSNEMVNELLSSGGMSGMLNVVWLILTAMVFGGIMESAGMLAVITNSIIQKVNSTGSLVASTACTCLFFNATTSDQYLAIVIPGRMYADTFKKRKLAPENLSRTLEDSGTVTSVLIPWNTCGAYQSGVLGISTLIYAPFCFFNIISFFMTIAFAYFNIKIKKIEVA